MFTSAKILLILILASFLVVNSQGRQKPEVSTSKLMEVSSASSSESSSDFSSESSTLSVKEIDTDSSETSSDSTEVSTQLDIFSGAEETEVARSSEMLSDDLSSEVYIVPSSRVTPTTKSNLFLDVPSDHRRTTALPRLNETSVGISIGDPTETSTEFDISSGTEDFDVPKSNEVLSGDMSSETDIVPSSSAIPTESALFPDVPMDEITASPNDKATTALPRLTETPVEISIEDPSETFTEGDISSETEEFEGSESNEIPSGDMSSEIDIVPSSSVIPTTKSVLSPDAPIEEITASPDHKGTTALPRLTEAPVEISIKDSTETSNVLSDDRTSEIDIVPSSSATPTTKSVLSPDVLMNEIPASAYHKGTTESVKPKESSDIRTTPASIQNPTTVMPMDNEIFILPSTTSTEFVNSNDSVKLPEQVPDASNTSKLVSNTAPNEKKTSIGIVFGVVLGSAVGAALLATVAFLLYRKRKHNLFAHQRFFDERNVPVHRLDNTTDTYNMSFGGPSFFNSAVPDDPVMEKNTERAGENIQMKTIPTASTLNKPWGIGLQNTESYFMPRTVSNP